MKRIALVAVVVLGMAGSAAAKAPPDGFRLCGVSACTPLAGNDAERVAISLFYGDAKLVAPPLASPSAFYVLQWQYPNQQAGVAYYVPASGVVRGASPAPGGFVAAGLWLQPNADVLGILSRVSGGLDAVQAPTPFRVTVGGRAVRDPASYVLVWTVGEPALPVHPRGWLRVRFTTATPSPWSDSMTDVRVSRHGGWLYRDGTYFRVQAAFAARIRARRSLNV